MSVRRLAWSLLVSMALGVAGADAATIEDALQSIPRGPPRFASGGSFRWIEYCPDETCDVVRTKRPIARHELQGVTLAYLFLESGYTYLTEWKADPSLAVVVKQFLDRQDSAADCRREESERRSKCILRGMAAKFELEVVFTRSDERKTYAQRKKLVDIIDGVDR
jgi:hypothetical protein